MSRTSRTAPGSSRDRLRVVAQRAILAGVVFATAGVGLSACSASGDGTCSTAQAAAAAYDGGDTNIKPKSVSGDFSMPKLLRGSKTICSGHYSFVPAHAGTGSESLSIAVVRVSDSRTFSSRFGELVPAGYTDVDGTQWRGSRFRIYISYPDDSVASATSYKTIPGVSDLSGVWVIQVLSFD